MKRQRDTPTTQSRRNPVARIKLAALLLASVLGVHWLRLQIAWGHNTDHRLTDQGRDHLAILGPTIGTVLSLALATAILRTARGKQHQHRRPASLTLLWAITAATVFAGYGAQELAEGLLSPGHPSGINAIIGDHGWTALPIACVLGLLIALTIRVARSAETAIAALAVRTAFKHVWQLADPRHSQNTPFKAPRRRPPLAQHCAGRAPPTAAQLI